MEVPEMVPLTEDPLVDEAKRNSVGETETPQKNIQSVDIYIPNSQCMGCIPRFTPLKYPHVDKWTAHWVFGYILNSYTILQKDNIHNWHLEVDFSQLAS